MTTTIITMTFTILILAWVLTHADSFKTVTTAIGGTFTGFVGSMMPKQ